jgi:tripartite ATP-independent transporter DctM subunit
MGLISLPIMLRYGYDKRLAAGVIAASGTLAQIIPPSLVLIIMADQLGKSVGDLYEGAMIPGLVLTSMYVGYVVILSIIKPSHCPALPPEARTLRGFKLATRVLTTLVPPLVLIFLVLGTIFLGVATPTEGGAMGAAGALILALARKRITMKLLRQAMETTGKLSSFVVFILVGSTVFGLIFRAVNGDLWVEHLLLGLPGGQVGFLIVVNILVFVLAFFLDFFELSFIIVPLLAPVADKLGIDLVWFGVLLAVNMQTSFMHPPFGFALFYLRSVAPAEVKTTDIYWGAIPFVCIQIIMVAIIIIFPGIVSYGDEASQNQARMERDGTAPPPIDLDAMMKQQEGGDAKEQEGTDNAAQQLKNLQGDGK